MGIEDRDCAGEGMDHNLGKIPGANNMNELQKIILLGTAHILRRFLSVHQIKNSPGNLRT